MINKDNIYKEITDILDDCRYYSDRINSLDPNKIIFKDLLTLILNIKEVINDIISEIDSLLEKLDSISIEKIDYATMLDINNIKSSITDLEDLLKETGIIKTFNISRYIEIGLKRYSDMIKPSFKFLIFHLDIKSLILNIKVKKFINRIENGNFNYKKYDLEDYINLKHVYDIVRVV